jgi:hypothetical protein
MTTNVPAPTRLSERAESTSPYSDLDHRGCREDAPVLVERVDRDERRIKTPGGRAKTLVSGT